MNQRQKPSHSSLLPIFALVVTFGCSARAGKKIVIELPALQAPKHLTVTSSDFSAGQAISRIYSSYGSNAEPNIHWSRPSEAKSYALMVEDPDAPGAEPFVHWIAFDLPQDSTGIVSHTNGQPEATKPGMEGKNDAGTAGYYGPHPPIGDEPHHYHFEVFALDRTLGLPAGTDRNALVAAMSGHVIASGELTGTYQEK